MALYRSMSRYIFPENGKTLPPTLISSEGHAIRTGGEYKLSQTS